MTLERSTCCLLGLSHITLENKVRVALSHMQHTAGGEPHQTFSHVAEILRIIQARGGAWVERVGLGGRT